MSESRGRAEGADRERGEAVSAPGHLVVTVHGIRTFGDWQADLKALLEEAEPGVTVLNYQYGYFSAVAFLVPPLRWLVARRFRQFLVQAIGAAPSGTRVDLVAHSFGTYLAATALPHVPEGRRLHTIVFAGSVLRPSFPWYRLQQRGVLGRVVNECGWDDTILVLCQFSALRMGMAGRVGFHGMVGGQFVNRYHRFGHGGYFDREGRFMRQHWLPLLSNDAPIRRVDERPPLTPLGGLKLTAINNLQFLKVAAATLAALALILIPLDWLHKADYQRRVQRSNSIARLANAVHIPGRDPSHVGDLLRIDARTPEEMRTINHVIDSEGAPEADDGAASDDEPAWWENLPGLRDRARDGYRAWSRHAQANFHLAAGMQGRAPDLSRAKLLYEDAIRAYARLAGDDPTYGSRALCLMDYGLLLGRMGLYKEAAEQFRSVREDVFPPGPRGDYPDRPRSLLVDSLCNEAKMLQGLEDWDAAAKRLWAARTGAEERPHALGRGEPEPREGDREKDVLLSYVFNELAWLSMQRLEVTKAVDLFARARESCEKLVDGGAFVFKTRLFHIRHGQAMAERLLGRTQRSYDQYDQIVRDLQGLMHKDFAFNPKERRDLAERLVNSMERRADVWFFGRPADAAGAGRAPLAKVQEHYQEAIDEIGNDDLSIKTRLMYKKIIACFLESLGGPPARAAREPVDVEFDEARRAYQTLSPELKRELKVYHQVASCCIELHRARRGGGDARQVAQAVGELRAVATDHARRCERLNRDLVEMLLVACEVLLEPALGQDQEARDRDASLMLAVLGASTKATSHGELGPYADRFNRLAAAHLRSSGREGGAHAGHEPPPAAAGQVLFFLRLSPTRSLTVTEGAELPAARSEQTAQAPGAAPR